MFTKTLSFIAIICAQTFGYGFWDCCYCCGGNKPQAAPIAIEPAKLYYELQDVKYISSATIADAIQVTQTNQIYESDIELHHYDDIFITPQRLNKALIKPDLERSWGKYKGEVKYYYVNPDGTAYAGDPLNHAYLLACGNVISNRIFDKELEICMLLNKEGSSWVPSLGTTDKHPGAIVPEEFLQNGILQTINGIVIWTDGADLAESIKSKTCYIGIKPLENWVSKWQEDAKKNKSQEQQDKISNSKTCYGMWHGDVLILSKQQQNYFVVPEIRDGKAILHFASYNNTPPSYTGPINEKARFVGSEKLDMTEAEFSAKFARISTTLGHGDNQTREDCNRGKALLDSIKFVLPLYYEFPAKIDDPQYIKHVERSYDSIEIEQEAGGKIKSKVKPFNFNQIFITPQDFNKALIKPEIPDNAANTIYEGEVRYYYVNPDGTSYDSDPLDPNYLLQCGEVISKRLFDRKFSTYMVFNKENESWAPHVATLANQPGDVVPDDFLENGILQTVNGTVIWVDGADLPECIKSKTCYIGIKPIDEIILSAKRHELSSDYSGTDELQRKLNIVKTCYGLFFLDVLILTKHGDATKYLVVPEIRDGKAILHFVTKGKSSTYWGSPAHELARFVGSQAHSITDEEFWKVFKNTDALNGNFADVVDLTREEANKKRFQSDKFEFVAD